MNKEEQVSSSTVSNLDYAGSVSIKLFNGERELQAKSVHNAGTSKLFNFFTNCLSGQWSTAEVLRPEKIMFFKSDDNESSNEFDSNYWTTDYQASPAIPYDTAPTPSTEETSSSITYHFRVPHLYLTAGKIKKIGLFPSSISSTKSNMLAYFILEDPINIPTSGGNYTIIIDWTLSITNETNVDKENTNGNS